MEGLNKNIALYLHLTRDCNLRCRYCYSGKKTSEPMSFEIGKKAVDFFLDHTDDLDIRFFGGEPLIEFELLRDIVLYTEETVSKRNKKIKYAVVTNATLLSKEVAEFFSHHRINYSITFDGNQQSQDINRVFPDGQGTFATVDRHIPLILHFTPYVNIVKVVNPDNIRYLSDSIQYFMTKGLRIIFFSIDFRHADFEKSLPMIEQEYYNLADIYLDYLRSGQRIIIDIFQSNNLIYNLRSRCGMGRQDFAVDPYGNIYPCTGFVDHRVFLLGNIDHGIDEEKYSLFLKELKRLDEHLEEVHKDCPATSPCRRGCGCTNIVLTGKVREIDPVVCKYGRMEAGVRDYVNSKKQSFGLS